METTAVRAPSRAYDVRIGRGLASGLDPLLDSAGVGARRFVVSSATVWRVHGTRIGGGLAPENEPILIPDGERFKNLQTVGRIYDALVRAEADRGAVLVAVGGGVVGDTAGFAAATYLRGIALVHVPTTLLAQVDSAIGGKVGVNHAQGKNLIGAFHQPVLVAVDPSLVDTLPRREFRAGLYEVVKYGMIADRSLFERVSRGLTALFARDAVALEPVIAACCRIKAAVVEADEREDGPRRILNFGHTAGHALEAVTRYRRFRHGEAVAYGMLAAAELTVARGAMPAEDRDALARLIVQMGPLPPVGDLSAAHVVEAMRRDKKVLNGRLRFVITPRIGEAAVIDDVDEKELTRALKKLGLR
ncbi:MAG: 3-dehydroquinate synthase [Vicinamibacterales bacterium]